MIDTQGKPIEKDIPSTAPLTTKTLMSSIYNSLHRHPTIIAVYHKMTMMIFGTWNISFH